MADMVRSEGSWRSADGRFAQGETTGPVITVRVSCQSTPGCVLIAGAALVTAMKWPARFFANENNCALREENSLRNPVMAGSAMEASIGLSLKVLPVSILSARCHCFPSLV